MSKITINGGKAKWLFGGFGFHNSEATMTPLMSEKLKNEVILKTFREISPTYSRVFAGYADWTREAMDRFADYYDASFRKAGTTLYLVPGRLPYITEDFNIDAYCERVASNLEYLINERHCAKIRYYCVTNELSVGNTYAYFSDHLDLFKIFHEKLYMAFKRHGLDIGLMATDCSGLEHFHQIDWAAENMDEVTECYCVHLYSNFEPDSLDNYQQYIDAFTPPVMTALSKEKRLTLGEFGQNSSCHLRVPPMVNDVCYAVDVPSCEGIHAIAILEEAMAAINSGCLNAAYWTLFDYPDPFLRENGDSTEEKAIYDAARFSGHGLDKRYNKHGLIKWSDLDNDYGSRAGLYTMGYMAKIFKKGTRVLHSSWDDEHLRCCAVIGGGGEISVAIINRAKEEKEITFELEGATPRKAFRRYDYDANNIPYNRFNDLQPCSALVELNGGLSAVITLAPCSVAFLTTDYVDRTPSAIRGVRAVGNALRWRECKDAEHCYYRVYRDGEQIASTVATSVRITPDEAARYSVTSVDKYGNEGADTSSKGKKFSK